MQTTQRLVVMGGFGAGPDLLDGVANAAHEMGIATADADVFTLKRSMSKPGEVAMAVRGAAVIYMHSAANLALSPRVWDWARGRRGDQMPHLVSFNGPEAHSMLRLIKDGAAEAARLVGRIAVEPCNTTVARAIGNAVASFPDDIRRLPNISTFSTAASLALHQACGVRAEGIVMADDRLCHPHPELYDAAGVPVSVQPGGHNQLLIDPHSVLRVWLDNGNASPAA